MKRTALLIILFFLSYITIFADNGVPSHIDNRVLASRSLEYFTARIDTKLYKPGARFVLIQIIRIVDGTVREEIYGHAKYVGQADPRHADIGLFKQIRGYQATSDMYVRYVSEGNPWKVFGGYLITSGKSIYESNSGYQLGFSHTFDLSQDIGLESGVRIDRRNYLVIYGSWYYEEEKLNIDIFTKLKLIDYVGTPMIRVEPFFGGFTRKISKINWGGYPVYDYGIILGSNIVIDRRFSVGVEYNVGLNNSRSNYYRFNSLIFSAGFRF